MAEAAATPAATPAGQLLCLGSELREKGRALLFELREYSQPVTAFAMRYDGRVVAYLNRCAHVPVQLDWQPGEFLDADQRFIICSLHGATYEPADGRCVGGPCGRGRLKPVAVQERDGRVYWYPDSQLTPHAAVLNNANQPPPGSPA